MKSYCASFKNCFMVVLLMLIFNNSYLFANEVDPLNPAEVVNDVVNNANANIVNNVSTNIGNWFYKTFSQQWLQNASSQNQIIMIEEKPFSSTISKITITANGKLLFKTMVNPSELNYQTIIPRAISTVSDKLKMVAQNQ